MSVNSRGFGAWLRMALIAPAIAPIGCAQLIRWRELPSAERDLAVAQANHTHATEPPLLPQAIRVAIPSGPPRIDFSGPQPVESFIDRALRENRTVQAAFHNVRSLRYRIPQVTVLDDPVASNTIFPIPSVAPQYSLMGYNPYNLTLAQQFPWYGTLRLRGVAADQDVRVALAELAAAQLDAVTAVKRAYYDLYAGLRTSEVLGENRKILEDFRAIAQSRLKTGGTQADVIRSEVLLTELDREIASTDMGIASARAVLAKQLHVDPDTELFTLKSVTLGTVPAEIDRLNQMALAASPELQGRLAAIARDETAVELAKKRSKPNVTLGLTYMDMEKTNAVTPQTASGTPNVGFVVGFNLPIYKNKYRAGVAEATERKLADTRLFEAQRDVILAEIKDYMTQAKVQNHVLSLLRESIQPRAKETLKLAQSDYAKSNVDYPTVLSALREVLQTELQIAQTEAELGKALASLERSVGCGAIGGSGTTGEPATVPPTNDASSPFEQSKRRETTPPAQPEREN